MSSTLETLRNYLKKFIEQDDGGCFCNFKNDDDNFIIMLDKNNKIIIFMENDKAEYKYAISFFTDNDEFFFRFDIKGVGEHSESFRKEIVNSHIGAAKPIRFDEDEMFRLDEFWIREKKSLEMVSSMAIHEMMVALKYIIKDLRLELSDFGFTNFD